jgi:hypothetical protein
VTPLASALTGPLEVVGVVISVSALVGGAAGAWSLLGGGSGDDITDAAVRGAAVGFIAGIYLGVLAAMYLLLR